MAELQYFPSTIQSGIPVLVNGVEVQNSDLALLGQTAGLADDRVLAELLRLMPTDGVNPVARTIVPAGYPWYTQIYNPETALTLIHNVYATVAPSGSANGSVIINPFRAVVGSRTPMGTSAIQNWRDNRSCVFVGSATTLTQTVTFGANSSGNPRWDLVYAQLTIDAPANSVQRRVKDPNATNPSIEAVFQYLQQSVVISVAAGTAGASPTIPNLPADSGSTYNIPLAAVLIPNGFGPTSTVLPEHMRDLCVVIGQSSPMGTVGMRPASGNHDRVNSDGTITTGTYGTDTNFAWKPGTSPFRSPLFLPPGMVGGEQRLVLMDFSVSGHPSHSSGSLVDDSVDWRNRYFRVMAFVNNNEKFASDPSATTGIPNIPFPLDQQDGRITLCMGQSFQHDDGAITNYATIYLDDDGSLTTSFFQSGASPIASGTKIGLVVSPNSGSMHAYVSGNPGCRALIWIEATGQFPNYQTGSP